MFIKNSGSFMAAIYVHIPLCKSRCFYCDFYSSTDNDMKTALIEAICREIVMRKDYLQEEPVQTIYFGGGTPSLLAIAEIEKIVECIRRNFPCRPEEITVEMNPDDVNETYVKSLKTLGVNRVSIGIQSFEDDELALLNRRHTAQQAIRAVKICQEAGVTNISIDLIYGLPGQTLDRWQQNLDIAMSLNVPHLSAYHLTYEPGTELYKRWQSGMATPVDEDVSEQMFRTLKRTCEQHDFVHYEISNFSRPGMHSRHNSAYWQDVAYLGVGPSAHSFNHVSRQWNVSNTKKYVEAINSGMPLFEMERLNDSMRYNDLIITSLRTSSGIDPQTLADKTGDLFRDYCLKNARPLIQKGLLQMKNNRLCLTDKSLFISDGVIADLLWVE